MHQRGKTFCPCPGNSSEKYNLGNCIVSLFRHSFLERFILLLRPTYDGPASWLWLSGIGRLLVLIVVAVGAQQISLAQEEIVAVAFIFAAALGCSFWYLLTLYRQQMVSSTLTWSQLLLDLCVVAFTISLTGGGVSYFTFLFVVVILEAGVLLGMVQGFAFALFSLVFIFLVDLPSAFSPSGILPFLYNFTIQWIALVSTAVISGYWNQRISRLKQFQREILDNMISGFLICDRRGKVLVVNKAACNILEMGEDVILSRNVAQVLPCASGTECPIITALQNARDYVSYEFLWQPAAGTPKMLGLTTNRLYDTRGRLVNIIAVFQDLTDMVALRQALGQQDRMSAVGESAAEFAHEIRSPLAALRSAVDELHRNLGAPEMASRLCNLALRESEHLNEIVSGFLEFARNPMLKYEPVEVGRLLKIIKCAVEQIHPDIKISLDCETPAVVIPGDATQIRQMCDNIIRNSIEAMQEKGEVVVTVRSMGSYVEIRFDDTGPGISPDKAMRIFEPFYTEKEKGFGMGLAVCMRIVTAHNGDIRAAARPGGGMSMLVRLPQMIG
jgi:two-component system, NtrC family, sensor histidine kinase PilS